MSSVGHKDVTVSGAQGVLASPFAPLHGLGSPLAAPYAGSPVGGTHPTYLSCTYFCLAPGTLYMTHA